MTDQLIPGREYVLLYPLVDDGMETTRVVAEIRPALEAGGVLVGDKITIELDVSAILSA